MTRCRRALVATGMAAGVALVSLAAPSVWIHASARGRIYTADSVPPAPVGMVLGAEAFEDGTPSPFLAARLDVGRRLLESGRVQRLLVTGDGSTAGLGETGAMRAYLIERGVNPDLIDIDDAGVDTHASCIRAKAAGVDSLIVVSQTYHLPRALALCAAAGVDAVGVGDESARRYQQEWAQGRARELLAAFKAVADVLRDRSRG